AVARAPLGLAILISKGRLVRIAGGAVWAALVVVMVHGVVVTRTNYQINRVVIESPRVPKNFSGYRILQLSDLHIGTMLNPEKHISELAELCNQEATDMIAMCGDLVNIRYEELTPSITEALQKFEARDGIYSIIGNHDVGVYIKDSITFTPDNNTRQLILRQKSLGWNVLDNSSEKIYRGGDSIFVTGITYEKELQDHRHSRKLPEVDFAAAYKGVDSDCFTITLSHIPQLWDKILSESQADLTLAGHVHAMQIKLPIGGRGLSPSALLYKRWSGLYEEQGRWLYVNDGIGCVGFPMRIGARPEITIFELRHAEPKR
ncbi:MAG: metallophosphoesterase, partial [Alistipes sp.]|nr:metallophosphoesterase [Alistipes sp.]